MTDRTYITVDELRRRIRARIEKERLRAVVSLSPSRRLVCAVRRDALEWVLEQTISGGEG